MFMPIEVPEKVVVETTADGLSSKETEGLRALIWDTHVQSNRRALGGDPATDAEPRPG